jgi:hypothetical protein
MMYDFDEELCTEPGFDQICENVQVEENVTMPTDLVNEPF